MAKIKLNNLPEGFEIKNGKVVKKMQQGGMSMGDQSNYGLVTNPYDSRNSNESNDPTKSVRYSLSSVPREIANIEAEGGETVLTDLQDSGVMGLYDIKGPRHSKGGVPLYLEEGSFVYSDTNAMKLNKKELAEFGIESKKKMTPADVSKKYKLNDFIALSENPDSDHISKKSAELMLNKNQMGLSKLAFTQEVKKQFEGGVPKTAHPYLMSQGIDPEEFSQKVNMANENKQSMQTMARNGYELPKAQFGLSTDVINTASAIADWLYSFIEPEAPKLTPKPDPKNNSEYIEQKYTDQPDYYVDQLRERKRVNDSIRNSQIKQYGDEINEDDFLPLAKNGLENSSNPMDEYTNLEKIFTSADPQWKKTLDRTYAAFVANAKKQGIPASKIPSREDMVTQALAYQKNNYLVKSLDPTGRFNKAFDKGDGSKKNKNTQAYFDKLEKEYPDQYQGYKIDEDQTKLNQLFFQAVALADKDNAEPFLDVISEGPDEGKKNWKVNTRISQAEGFLGNNTLNQFLKVRQPKTPGKSVKETPKETPEEIPDPEFNIPKDNLKPAMWLQDKIKLGALAARKRNLGMPSNMYVKDPDIEWALLDPTRLIAANNETYNTTLQGIGAFAGPQSQAARASQAAGKTFANNANAIAQIQGSNINTVNQGLRFKAQMDAQTEAFRRQSKNDEYDKTTLAIENYINEKNFDREQAADLYANAITNKWNTDTLNKLNPYYNVDTASGGRTTFTGDANFNANKQSANQLDKFTQMQQDALSLKGSGIPEGTVNKMLDIKYGLNTKNNQGFGADPYADMMRQMRSQGAPAGYTGKKGKEIKKYATPFYMGKTGY